MTVSHSDRFYYVVVFAGDDWENVQYQGKSACVPSTLMFQDLFTPLVPTEAGALLSAALLLHATSRRCIWSRWEAETTAARSARRKVFNDMKKTLTRTGTIITKKANRTYRPILERTFVYMRFGSSFSASCCWISIFKCIQMRQISSRLYEQFLSLQKSAG